MKNNIKKYIKYFLPPLIVTILLLLIYSIKGIYPFGSRSIAQADLAQSYVPVYTWLYDVLKGDIGIFFNYNLGAGLNMYGSIVLNALFSPVSWLVCLTERGNILNFFSILLLIRLALMSITSFICFDKTFKNVNVYYKTIFSVMYSFSGYVFLNYSNIQWLDNLILFPLLVLSLKHLYESGKSLPFIIILTINLIFTLYISYMILLFVIFGTFSYLLFCSNKENYSKICLKVFLSIIISLCLSAFSFIPAYMQSSQSYRIANVNSDAVNIYLYSKLVYYLCSSISVYYFCKMKRSKITNSIILTFLFTFIGVFIEPINLMWHTGSYTCFPYRYGFIPLFIMLLGGLNYLNSKNETLEDLNLNILKNDYKYILIFLVLLYLSILVVYTVGKDILTIMMSISIVSKITFIELLIVFILFLLLVVIANKVKNKLLKYIMISIVLICEIISYGIYYIGFDYKYVSYLNHTDILVRNSFELYDSFDLSDSNYLYKDNTQSLTANYPYITKTRALSNWYHIITSEQLINHVNLGYSYNYTRMHDDGGTLFSDIFYGIKYVFSYEELNSDIYTKIEENNNIKLYENKYTLPLLKYNNNQKIDFKLIDAFYNQNQIYKNFFMKDDNIIQVYDYNNLKMEYKDGHAKIYIPVSEPSNIYLYLKQFDMNIYDIRVNENIIHLYNSYNSQFYPNEGNNGIIDLGFYSENIIIEFDYVGDITETLQFGVIEHNKIINLYDELNENYELNIKGSSFSLHYESSRDGYVFIPINYNDGFKAVVNGKKVQIEKYLDTYINIPVNEGNNDIIVTFFPPYLKISIIISLLSLLMLIIIIFVNKKNKLEDNNIIKILGLILFYVTFVIIFFIININNLI